MPLPLFASSDVKVRMALLAGFIVALAAGCGMSSSSMGFGGASDVPLNDSDGDTTTGFGATVGDAGASTKTPSPYRGSPLCGATKLTCFPDDDGMGDAGAGQACATDVDGGVDTDAGAPSTAACRVRVEGTVSSGSSASPVCTAEGTGGEGASCAQGADCARGFECVSSGPSTGGQATGECHRYCCDGACSITAANGGKTFCDIQPVVDLSIKVPVCIPVKPCELLAIGQCDLKETCSVVREDGMTGCVAEGPARVGESCDETHCGSDLTCLGLPGSRKCFLLCKVSAPTCALGDVCKGSAPLFKDPAYGLCQPP